MRKLLILILISLSTLTVSAQKKNTPRSYIEKHKDEAIKIMHETGVPASIVLGVAMHESACGNSKLATHLNNQFGVKDNHNTIYYVHNKREKTLYRSYPNIYESFMDFAKIMINNPEFSILRLTLSHWDSNGWAYGIQRHHAYASSRKWSSQVLGIINSYHLGDYDEKPTQFVELLDTTKNVQTGRQSNLR